MEIRFLANIIDQLDFALDHIMLQDTNYKRLALMLIDNAVELALHQHAEESKGREWDAKDKSAEYQKALSEALGQRFDSKVKFGRISGLITDETAQSINALHSYRNQLYHQGVMHEGILHGLAVFYFRIACDLLAALPMHHFSWSSTHRIPHRAIKYIGNPRYPDPRKLFPPVWARLKEVSEGIAFDLVADLRAALTELTEETDRLLNYLAEGHPGNPSRDALVTDAQAWRIAFTDEGKRFAATNSCPEQAVGGYVQWLGQNYHFTFRNDPVPGWKDRLASFVHGRDPHAALRKYQEFVSQTQFVREAIEASAAALDAEIDRQIDAAREGNV
jgi:hypothetical protein